MSNNAHPSFDDKKSFMAWMRSRIKNKTGRKINRKTENFLVEKTLESKNTMKDSKSSNEHIKCVSISLKDAYPRNNTIRSYIIGFLTDSNRFSFEILRDNTSGKNSTKPGVYRLKKMHSMFMHKRIDENTVIVSCIDAKFRIEFIPILINFISNMVGCDFLSINVPRLIFILDSELNIFRKSSSKIRTLSHIKNIDNPTLYKRLHEAYDFVRQSGACPWIGDSMIRKDMKLTSRALRSIEISELAMLIAMIRSYKNLRKNLKRKIAENGKSN